MSSSSDSIFKNKKLRPVFASLCALGWSMAYPLIKIGYSEFGIAVSDLGSKILFAGVRFFTAGTLVIIMSIFQKRNMRATSQEASALLVFALINTALHYLFSYIGLSYIPSSRSTILDSMGGFLLIIWSSLILRTMLLTAKRLQDAYQCH